MVINFINNCGKFSQKIVDKSDDILDLKIVNMQFKATRTTVTSQWVIFLCFQRVNGSNVNCLHFTGTAQSTLIKEKNLEHTQKKICSIF